LLSWIMKLYLLSAENTRCTPARQLIKCFFYTWLILSVCICCIPEELSGLCLFQRETEGCIYNTGPSWFPINLVVRTDTSAAGECDEHERNMAWMVTALPNRIGTDEVGKLVWSRS
jgi:hypothetical protein